jgi:site-specific recombinase XerD
LWLARCAQKSRNGFSASSRNAHVQMLKEVFALALRDKIISDLPAAHLRYIKRQKPIRLTPTWEHFKAIISDVRAQVFKH